MTGVDSQGFEVVHADFYSNFSIQPFVCHHGELRPNNGRGLLWYSANKKVSEPDFEAHFLSNRPTPPG